MLAFRRLGATGMPRDAWSPRQACGWRSASTRARAPKISLNVKDREVLRSLGYIR